MTNTIYFLFAGDYYYPDGGMRDLRGTFDSIDAAMARAARFNWWHIATIVDGQLTIIKEFYS